MPTLCYRFIDTPLLGTSTKLILAGLPFAKVQDAVLAIVYVS